MDRQDSIRKYAGPGRWNDPDMLEVGNGMTYTEDKAHFSLWCTLLAAPLMAGNDLRKMSDQTKDILTNKEVIAVEQELMGVEGFKYYSFDGLEIFVRPLNNGELAVCFLNRSDRTQNISYEWIAHAIQDKISNTDVDFTKASYKIHDVWTKKDMGTTQKTFHQSYSSA